VPPTAELVFIRNPSLFVACLGLFVVITARVLAWRSARYRHDRLPVFDADTDSVQQLGLLSPGHLSAPTTLTARSDATSEPGMPWFSRVSAGAELDVDDVWRLDLDLLRRDVSFALRRLRTAPAFTLFSAATLALGIGATTAIYSVVYAAALRPPAIADIDRVVNLYHADPSQGGNPLWLGFSLPDYEDLRASQTTFSQIAAWQGFRQMMIVNGVGEVVFGEVVGGDYFSLMGVGASRGRTIQPADDRPGAPAVVVISDRFWRQRLGADPAAVGKTVRMNGHVFEIVGIAPAAFGGVLMPNITPTPVWVPLSCASLLNYAPRGAQSGDREARWLFAKARLKPGRTFAQAAAEVASIGHRLDLSYPIGRDLPRYLQAPPDVSRQWQAMRAADLHINESVHRYVVPLAALAMAAVGLVLLVACTNLANLMLARGAARRQELAVRLALGASRGRLVGEQLVESALVALVGGVAAIGVARVLMVWIASASVRLAPGLTVQIAPALNLSVGLVAIGATAVALLVFGLAPALQLTRTDVRSALSAADSNATGPRWRGRRNLIAGQVAVSVALVGVAAIAIHQTVLATTRDAGLDLERLALARMDFKFQGWDEARARQTLARVLDVVEHGGGVESAALASWLPVDPGADSAYLTSPDRPFADGQRSGRRVRPIVATSGVFRTFGVAIRRGRAFDERDSAAAEPVIVLSELAARAVFGETDPLGRQVLMRGPSDLKRTETPTVVGVAADTDSGRIGDRTEPVVYVPFAQHYEARMAIVARAYGDPGPLVGRLDIAIRRADPEVGITDAGTGIVLGGVESVSLRILAGLTGLLGLLALVLAMVGLYGVVSYVTVRRTREMGVRVALGATRQHIVQLVLADGLRPVLEGLAVGFALSGVASVALRPVFERLMPALDPLMFAVVPIPFLVIALVACYVPARRASRVDPNVALRQI
jgi:predicted permease